MSFKKYFVWENWVSFLCDRLKLFPMRMLPWRAGTRTGFIDVSGFSEQKAKELEGIYQIPFVVTDSRLNKQAGEFGSAIKYPEIVEMIPKGARVLDLGCGPGKAALDLIALRDANVVGLDVSTESVAVCKEHGIEAYQCDINNFDDPTLQWAANEDWDYVMGLGGVLQNFDYPFVIMKLFRKSVGIYHVVNIGHYFYRLRLLMGRFPYTPTESIQVPGRPPYAHLNITKRYWTLKDFESICEMKGLAAEKVSRSPCRNLCYNLFTHIATYKVSSSGDDELTLRDIAKARKDHGHQSGTGASWW